MPASNGARNVEDDVFVVKCCISLDLNESGHVRSPICMSTNGIGRAKERSSGWDGNSKPQDQLSVAVKRAVKRLYRTKGHMILVDQLLWQQTHLLVYTNVVHGQMNTSQYEKRMSTNSCLKRTLYKPYVHAVVPNKAPYCSNRWQKTRALGHARCARRDAENCKMSSFAIRLTWCNMLALLIRCYSDW